MEENTRNVNDFSLVIFYAKLIIMFFKKIDWETVNKRKLGLIIAFTVIIGALAWAFIGALVITKNFNRQQIVGKENSQKLDISGIILTETKQDKKYWEIYGETGHYSSDNKIALLENVTGNFYSNNEVSMSFKSTRGTYNSEKKQIILFDNTYIVIKDGTSLNCDRLVWSGSDKPTVATGNLKIRHGNELIATAKKAIIKPGYAKFEIKGNSVTKLYDKKEIK